MNKDYIMLIHRFGYEHLGEAITRRELYDFLRAEGVNTDDGNVRNGIEETIHEAFERSILTSDYMTNGLSLKNESYYRYIEYIELSEARANTKSANRNAILAVLVSILLALVQIYVQIKQN